MPPTITFSHSALQSIGGSAGTKTFSHTFSGSGAASVMIVRGHNHNDHISAVSIGGQALTRIADDAQFTPSRHAEIWATASGVPAGSQTVSITFNDGDTAYAVATDVSIAGGVPAIGPTGSSGTSSGAYSATLDSGSDEARGIACMVITGGSGNPGTDQAHITGSPTTPSLTYHFIEETTQNAGARNNGFSGNNPHAGAGMLWLGTPTDIEAELTTPLALELEVAPDLSVIATGDISVVLFTPLALELQVPPGMLLDNVGPLQVALEGLDMEVHRTTTGGTEGQVLTYHEATEPSWEDSAGGASALDDLTDVDAPTPGDGEVLTWDSGSSSWVAAPGATGSGNVVGVWDDAEPATPAQDETIWYDTDASTPVASAEASGTAFPSSPLANTRFYRTDIRGGMWFRYNGTRWLSEQLFSLPHWYIVGTAADSARVYWALPTDYNVYVTNILSLMYLSGASASWTLNVETFDFDGDIITTLLSKANGATAAKFYRGYDAINAVVNCATGVNATDGPTGLSAWVDEVSGAVTFFGSVETHYRLIAA